MNRRAIEAFARRCNARIANGDLEDFERLLNSDEYCFPAYEDGAHLLSDYCRSPTFTAIQRRCIDAVRILLRDRHCTIFDDNAIHSALIQFHFYGAPADIVLALANVDDARRVWWSDKIDPIYIFYSKRPEVVPLVQALISTGKRSAAEMARAAVLIGHPQVGQLLMDEFRVEEESDVLEALVYAMRFNVCRLMDIVHAQHPDWSPCCGKVLAKAVGDANVQPATVNHFMSLIPENDRAACVLKTLPRAQQSIPATLDAALRCKGAVTTASVSNMDMWKSICYHPAIQRAAWPSASVTAKLVDARRQLRWPSGPEDDDVISLVFETEAVLLQDTLAALADEDQDNLLPVMLRGVLLQQTLLIWRIHTAALAR